ncbi:MAG: hypothetical protein QXE01_02525 [Sulfolobales archaeon]
MEIGKLFPTYPIQPVSPRKENIRIASRRIYVDFPYVFWEFIGNVLPKIIRSENPRETLQKEWELFISNEKVREIVTFNGALLGAVSLVATPSTSKLLLKLKVNWPVFLQYLENEAQELVSEVEKDSSSIMGVYNLIIYNYFKIALLIPTPEVSRFNVYEMEKFKKLLRRLHEEQDIKRSLQTIREAIRSIRERSRVRAIELWMLQLESDFYGVEKSFENLDILSCYFYLRNALENLVRLVFYSDIAREITREIFNKKISRDIGKRKTVYFDIYDQILGMFFFYDKTAKKHCSRKCEINELKDEYIKKIVDKIAEFPRIIHKSDLEKMLLTIAETLDKESLPRLSISKHILKEFREKYKIDIPIENYWSACSEILHNQSPLPFFSLLEVKAFKHFLRLYVRRFLSLIKVIPSIIEITTERSFEAPVIELEKSSTIAEEVMGEEVVQGFSIIKQKRSRINRRLLLRILNYEMEEEIRVVLKSLISELISDEDVIEERKLIKKLYFDLLTLASLFHLLSPPLRRIYSGEFGIDDVDYLITKIQPLSYHIDLKSEFYTTLQMLGEKIIPKLEQIFPPFSILDQEVKRAVTFYLLALELPRLLAL